MSEKTLVERLEEAWHASCGCTDLSLFTQAAERIEALEAALKPFAATGAVLEAKPKDDACWAGQVPAPPITFGHLRAAARALA